MPNNTQAVYHALSVVDAHSEEHKHHESPTVFGFWIYLMTDCLLFATLFAIFAVLRHQFAGGPTGQDIFDLKGVAIETGVLLVSSITYGFAMLGAFRQRSKEVVGWLIVTFILGLTFICLEIKEFTQLISHGAGPQTSAFLSSFYALVSTHGIHVTIGLIWIMVMIYQVMGQSEISPRITVRLTCLSLFWHFLDIVWICVFTFVYLMSVV